jgi:uncharacterized protein YbjT (DUF2867 family)
MNVLVTGATGFVGRSLVPALCAAGHDVTAMTRDASSYDPETDVTVVECDLLAPATLDGAFDGIDAAYYLVHSMNDGGSFAERDRRAATNFAREASRAGVERVIYLGGLGASADALSEHLRSRREVEAVLDEGAYDLTTLRAAIIVGDGSVSFRLVTQLSKRLPIMLTPKWVRTDCQPIAIDDVVGYLLGVLDAPATADDTFEIGGPEVLTYGDLLKRTARHLGSRALIVPVPVLTPQLSVYWVTLVTDVPGSVARPLVDGLKNPVVVTDDRIRDLVPISVTPLDEAIERALGRESDAGDATAASTRIDTRR